MCRTEPLNVVVEQVQLPEMVLHSVDVVVQEYPQLIGTYMSGIGWISARVHGRNALERVGKPHLSGEEKLVTSLRGTNGLGYVILCRSVDDL